MLASWGDSGPPPTSKPLLRGLARVGQGLHPAGCRPGAAGKPLAGTRAEAPKRLSAEAGGSQTRRCARKIIFFRRPFGGLHMSVRAGMQKSRGQSSWQSSWRLPCVGGAALRDATGREEIGQFCEAHGANPGTHAPGSARCTAPAPWRSSARSRSMGFGRCRLCARAPGRGGQYGLGTRERRKEKVGGGVGLGGDYAPKKP